MACGRAMAVKKGVATLSHIQNAACAWAVRSWRISSGVAAAHPILNQRMELSKIK